MALIVMLFAIGLSLEAEYFLEGIILPHLTEVVIEVDIFFKNIKIFFVSGILQESPECRPGEDVLAQSGPNRCQLELLLETDEFIGR